MSIINNPIIMVEQEGFDPNQVEAIQQEQGVGPAEQERREQLAESISGMTGEEIEHIVEPALEKGELRPGIDFDLVKGIAIGVVERGRAETKEDALIIGAIGRIKAKEILGNLGVQEVVLDEQGNVVAIGSDRISAMRKAGEETKQE